MPKAEGKRFDFKDQSAIDTKVLETLPYDGARQTILIESEEFSAVCPFSGLPDYGLIAIEYTPRKVFVELKSLKYYFTSYRNVGIYQEDATNRIFADLKGILKPERLKVTLKYRTRGGMDTTCVMEGSQESGVRSQESGVSTPTSDHCEQVWIKLRGSNCRARGARPRTK